MLGISSLNKNQILRINEIAQRLEKSDEFRVIDLFHGGMGVCAKIRNEISGNEYALKTIQASFVEEYLTWTMFVEEMKTWLTLSACDGIVEAYCIARINELPYVCAKWMSGGDLRPLITTKDYDFFYKNITRIIRTLEWANNKHQIIHRDLKPENILLDSAGLAYVTDWGLARPVTKETHQTDFAAINFQSNSRPELTQAGEFRGTISYASPEQIMGLREIDHRSDIYSLGCILFEWETGRRPFLGSTAEEIAIKHLTETAPQIGGFLRRTNFGVEKIIDKCLKKNPNDRFQDYDSLANSILEVARKRSFQFAPYIPQERYLIPEIGQGEYRQKIKSKTLGQTRSEDGSHFIVDFDEIEPYLREVEILTSLGEWQKALEIYSSLFVPEATQAVPDYEYCQDIAINYALCLINTGSPEKAISVLRYLDKAQSKPATYFVNLSLAYLHLQSFNQTEEIAKQGLSIYEDDKDLWGNLLISQINQSKLSEASVTAKKRLQFGRDVHVLEEVALLSKRIAANNVEKNLPEAIKYFNSSLKLLHEAKELNPRYLTTRLSIANVYFEIQKYSESISELQEMFNLEMHPTIKEFGIVQFAKCLDGLAFHKECLDFCDKWLQEFSQNISLQRIRAETIIDGFCIGRVEEDGTRIVERSSLEFFESIIETENVQISDFCYLARIYEWIGKIKTAMNLLDKAEELENNYWEITFNRAAFLWRLNNLDEALENSTKATEISPWRPQTWRLLAAIYKSLGQEEKFEQITDKAELVEQKREELFGT